MQFTINGGIKYKKKSHKRIKLPAFSPKKADIYIQDATPLCQVGDTVALGTPIAFDEVSSKHYYSSIEGQVLSVSDGFIRIDAKALENTGAFGLAPYDSDFDTDKREALVNYLLLAGHPDGEEISYRFGNDTTEKVVINCVCDPSPEDAVKIITGAKILLCALGIRSAVLAISKDNKKFARAVEKQNYPKEMFVIAMLPLCYPLEEPTIVRRALFPYKSDEKCFVTSHSSCIAAFDCFVGASPFTSHKLKLIYKSRCAEVDCPVGTTVEELCTFFAQGLNTDPTRLVAYTGASGLGMRLSRSDVIGSDVTAITFKRSSRSTAKVSPICIGCGKCQSVCPVGLSPILLSSGAISTGAEKCISCNCCTHACPVGIDLADSIKNKFSEVGHE